VRMIVRHCGKENSSRRLLLIDSADWRILGLGRLLQVPPQSWLGECPSRSGRSWQVRLPSWSTPVSSTSSGVCRSLYGWEASRHGFGLLEIFISSCRSSYRPSDDALQSGNRAGMAEVDAVSEGVVKKDQETFDWMFTCAKLQLQAEVPPEWPWRSQPC
jgi:hypothetical protein